MNVELGSSIHYKQRIIGSQHILTKSIKQMELPIIGVLMVKPEVALVLRMSMSLMDVMPLGAKTLHGWFCFGG